MVKFIRRIAFFGIILVGGLIFLINGIKDNIEFSKPHGDLETITADELYEGRIVEGTIYELWHEFAYTEEYDTTLGIKSSKERTTDRYFALPLEYSFEEENPIFVAVSSRNSDTLRTFEQMENETIDYFNGKEYDEYTSIHFVGKVQKLSGEYLQFFKEYIAEIYGVSEKEAEKYYAPYVLTSYSNNGGLVPMIVVGAVMTLIGLCGVGFFIVRKVLTGR